MHKLYNVTYTITDGDIATDEFASGRLFTEEDLSEHIDTFYTFNDFFDAVSSYKHPYSNCNYGISILGRPFVTIYGVRFDYTITDRNFKSPLQIKTTYKECSTKYNDIDFFKKNLSVDDFVIFLREHGYGNIQTYIGEKAIENKSPKEVINDLINTIERELQNSTSTRYRTAEGDYIDTDVDYVYDWFKEYKEVLRLRYEK